MAERIKRNAPQLRDQMTQAAAQVLIEETNGLWPTTAPTSGDLTTAKNNLATSISDTEAKETAWKTAAQLKATRVTSGIDLMKAVDTASDVIYGPSAAEKNLFGLPPKGAPVEPLAKLIEIVVTDGPVAGSLKFDWEALEGAAYEVQWSTTSDFAALVGSAVSASASDYLIGGLNPGTQYWMRVRPVRGGEVAPWSDPATRVAPI